MLTTQAINFYSHYVLSNGVIVGEIHGIVKTDPVAGTDRTMWEGYLNGKLVGETDTFMKTFRLINNIYKSRKAA